MTRKFAQAWIAAGHRVTWFASAFGSAPATEVLDDGIQVMRAGREWTVQWHAYRAFRRGKLVADLVVDEIHGFGFMTPWYVQERRVALIFEVAGEIWRYTHAWPIAVVGRWLEPILLRAYHTTRVATFSDSTAGELREVGIPHDQIAVLKAGLTFEPPVSRTRKDAVPTVISLGWVGPAKQTLDLIEAFAQVRRVHKSARLWIVGAGDPKYVAKCERRVAALGLSEATTFFGYVDPARKIELLARAWVLASCSVKEGWGLIVAEANAVGTPVATYPVAGFRDSVKKGWGALASAGRPPEIAQAIQSLFPTLADPPSHPRPASFADAANAFLDFALAGDAPSELEA